MSPVSRGRGKRNKSARGPRGKRAAARRTPSDGVLGLIPDPPASLGGTWPSPASSTLLPGHLDELFDAAPGRPDGAIPMADLGGGLRMSWVTIERLARERASAPGTRGGRPYRDDAEQLTDAQLLGKLRDFGIDLDEAGLEALCRDALSAEEVAEGLLSEHLSAAQRLTKESDWIWLAVLTLWQRWWPTKLCLETVDDKMQAGYREYQHDAGAATDVWLEVWADVLALCDREGITTVGEFDDRFSLTQSLFNWHQDLEMELGNAGLHDPAKLRARIAVGEEVLRRFTDCDELASENWRRAIGEAWFWLGETATADELFRQWLEADPQWGYGWIGWSCGHLPPPSIEAPTDHQRAEDLLRQGLAISDVRDRDAIMEWLRDAREGAQDAR